MWKNFIVGLDRFLFYVSIIPPAILFLVGMLLAFVKKNPDHWYSFLPGYSITPIAIGLLTIVVHVVKLSNQDDKLLKIKEEIKYILQAESALTFGSGFAITIVGIYLAFPSDGNLASRFLGALSLYVSCLGTVLVTDLFYKNNSPITDVDDLLERVTRDFKKCRDQSNVWIVFPAMNIGFYRKTLKFPDGATFSSIDSSDIYRIYREAFLECADKLKAKFRVVCYDTPIVEKMYEEYDTNHRSNNIISPQAPFNKKVVAECVNEHSLLLPQKIREEVCEPEKIPPYVIIIDEVVYTIDVYGLPTYSNGNFQIGEKGELASIFAYRRENSLYAKEIIQHLTNLFPSLQ